MKYLAGNILYFQHYVPELYICKHIYNNNLWASDLWGNILHEGRIYSVSLILVAISATPFET